jgi:hypothetical protein
MGDICEAERLLLDCKDNSSVGLTIGKDTLEAMAETVKESWNNDRDRPRLCLDGLTGTAKQHLAMPKCRKGGVYISRWLGSITRSRH